MGRVVECCSQRPPDFDNTKEKLSIHTHSTAVQQQNSKRFEDCQNTSVMSLTSYTSNITNIQRVNDENTNQTNILETPDNKILA